MKPQDVLLNLLAENDYYVHAMLDDSPEECLHWRPAGKANSIAILIWHIARASDVFFTHGVKDRTTDDEIWFSKGWAQKAAYDPRGAGTYGWGQLTGYSPEEVDAIPAMSKEVLRGYYDAVSSAVRAYLNEVSMAELEGHPPVPEGEESVFGGQPRWFWVKHPIFDASRHAGEMQAIKGWWRLQNEGA